MYDNIAAADRSNTLVDLRSDTVTQPSPGMRKAMADAEVGDDVYRDDPTVIELEHYVADLMGKEAALFVTSGTQSNLVALLTHCGRGDEYIGGVGYHISKDEAGGAAVLGGISPRHLQLDTDGGLKPEEIEAAIQPDDEHYAISRLICLENTHNGMVQDQKKIESARTIADNHELALHLDGARLMNAVVKSGQPASKLVAPFDTVSLCLSKGLGGPAGSVLSGTADFIRKARRNRKILGGGLRQAGVLAACGLYALKHNVDRMAEDHSHAKAMAARLSEIEGWSIDQSKVQTNMVWIDVNQVGNGSFREHMQLRGIVVPEASVGSTIRLVTHLDFAEQHIDAVIDGVASWVAQ